MAVHSYMIKLQLAPTTEKLPWSGHQYKFVLIYHDMVGKRLQRFYLLYCQINILWEEIILSEGGTVRKNATYRHALLQITLFLAKGVSKTQSRGRDRV